jgi:hypothetical protein
MTSGKQSKAQRRAENQAKEAARRAAIRRKKMTRQGLIALLVVVAIVAVVVVIKVVTSPSTPAIPPSETNPHVHTTPIPASLHMIPAPATSPGYEGPPIPKGPKLATLFNAATGATTDGIQCQTDEQTVTHVHTHLTVFVNGQARTIPYGIGIPGAETSPTKDGPFVVTGNCFYWLHTHANDGVIHIESPSLSDHFTLGQFFAIWGVPLSSTQVASYKGTVTTFFGTKTKAFGIYHGDPADLPLGAYYEIELNVGTPIVKPVQVASWGQL